MENEWPSALSLKRCSALLDRAPVCLQYVLRVILSSSDSLTAPPTPQKAAASLGNNNRMAPYSQGLISHLLLAPFSLSRL